eukprot:764056-Pleurochrysis_carterae.AAC.1
MPPHSTQNVLLRYTTNLPGPNCAVEVQPLPQLFLHFPELHTPVQTDLSAIHQSMYSVAFFPLHNPSDEPVLLLHSTQFGSVTLRPDLGVSQGEFTIVPPSDSSWEGVDGAYALAAEESGELHLEREEIGGQCLDREGVAEAAPDTAENKADVSLRSADANEGRALFEGLRSFALPMTVERHRNYHELPFKKGGPAR